MELRERAMRMMVQHGDEYASGRAAVSALRQRQVVHAAARQQLGDRGKGGAWVFTSPRGTPLDGNPARAAWRSLSQRAQLPMIRFHDLRHTAATLSLGPRSASEGCGRSSGALDGRDHPGSLFSCGHGDAPGSDGCPRSGPAGPSHFSGWITLPGVRESVGVI